MCGKLSMVSQSEKGGSTEPLELPLATGLSVCEGFCTDNEECPLTLRSEIITTEAVHNTDHNPSSTNAHNSFHGTGTPLIQHPDCLGQSTDRNIIGGAWNAKAVGHVPRYYTDVPPVTALVKCPPIPRGTRMSLRRVAAKAKTEQEKVPARSEGCMHITVTMDRHQETVLGLHIMHRKY